MRLGRRAALYPMLGVVLFGASSCADFHWPSLPSLPSFTQAKPEPPPPVTPSQIAAAQAASARGDMALVRKEYPEALKSFREAADHGNATAQNKLGLMYANGLG